MILHLWPSSTKMMSQHTGRKWSISQNGAETIISQSWWDQRDDCWLWEDLSRQLTTAYNGTTVKIAKSSRFLGLLLDPQLHLASQEDPEAPHSSISQLHHLLQKNNRQCPDQLSSLYIKLWKQLKRSSGSHKPPSSPHTRNAVSANHQHSGWTSKPSDLLFTLVPSGRKYQSTRGTTVRHYKSFFSEAVRILNTLLLPSVHLTHLHFTATTSFYLLKVFWVFFAPDVPVVCNRVTLHNSCAKAFPSFPAFPIMYNYNI